MPGEALVVGDDQQRRPGLGAASKKQVDDRGTGRGIEIAGRLVREHQRGARGERAGDGDALLLTAGKLGGIMRKAVAKADSRQFRLRAFARFGHSGQFERCRHVFERGHRWQQVEGLQHHADPAAPGPRQGVFVHPRKVLSGDL